MRSPMTDLCKIEPGDGSSWITRSIASSKSARVSRDIRHPFFCKPKLAVIREEMQINPQVPVDEAGKSVPLTSANQPKECLPCPFFLSKSGCARGLQCEFDHCSRPRSRKKCLIVESSIQ